MDYMLCEGMKCSMVGSIMIKNQILMIHGGQENHIILKIV
jgi:hypothetical protein